MGKDNYYGRSDNNVEGLRDHRARDQAWNKTLKLAMAFDFTIVLNRARG